MDDRAPKILLDYTPDEIIALIGEQAKIAFKAELDFFEWRAENEPAPFKTFMEKYLEWVECGEPFADSYARIASEYPELTEKIEAIVLPIKLEILGTE